MARNITITNGVGTANITNGTYTVTSTVDGYDNTSILPNSLNVVEGTDSYSFTIAATGTLTLHVTEEGTVDGTPIVGATFKRADSSGNQYGDLITTDANGDAIMQYVPYAATGAPAVYYVQLSSDGSHEFSQNPVSVTLTTQAYTTQVTNALSTLRTINVYDANYTDLPISSGTLTLE